MANIAGSPVTPRPIRQFMRLLGTSAQHWVVDPSLEAGSFRLVSPERIIDGRVDVALRALYERLASD